MKNFEETFDFWLSDAGQCALAFAWIKQKNQELDPASNSKQQLLLKQLDMVKEMVQCVRAPDYGESSLVFLALYFMQTDEDCYDQKFVVECLLKFLELKSEYFRKDTPYSEEKIKELIDKIFSGNEEKIKKLSDETFRAAEEAKIFIELIKCLSDLVSAENFHFAAEIAVRFLKSREDILSILKLPEVDANFLGKVLGFLCVYEVANKVGDEYHAIVNQMLSVVANLQTSCKVAREFLGKCEKKLSYKAKLIVLEKYLTHLKNKENQSQVDSWLEEILYDLSYIEDAEKEKYAKICASIVTGYRSNYGIGRSLPPTSKLQEWGRELLPSFFSSPKIDEPSIEKFEEAASEFLSEEPVGIIPTVAKWKQLISENKRLIKLTGALEEFWKQQTVNDRVDKIIAILSLCHDMRSHHTQVKKLKNSCLDFLAIVLGKSVETLDEGYLAQLELRHSSIGLNYLPNDGLFGKRLMRYLEYICFIAINSDTAVRNLDHQIIIILDTIQDNLKKLSDQHSNFKKASVEYIMACVVENQINEKTAKLLLDNMDAFLNMEESFNYLDVAIKSKKITKDDYYKILTRSINDALDSRELLAIEPEMLCKEVLFKFLCQLTSKKIDIKINDENGTISQELEDTKVIKRKFDITEFKLAVLVQLKRFLDSDFIIYDAGTKDAAAKKNKLNKTKEFLNLLFIKGSVEISPKDRDVLTEELGSLSQDNRFIYNEYYTDSERMNNTLFINAEGKIVVFEKQDEYLALKLVDTRSSIALEQPDIALGIVSMEGELIKIDKSMRSQFRVQGECVQLPFGVKTVCGLVKTLNIFSNEPYFKPITGDIARILLYKDIDFSGCTFRVLNKKLEVSAEFSYKKVGQLSSHLSSFSVEVNKFCSLMQVLTANIINQKEKAKYLDETSLPDKLDGLADLMKINLGTLNKELVRTCLSRLNEEIDKPWIKRVSKISLIRGAIKYALENLDKADFIENCPSLVSEYNLLVIIKKEFESYMDRLEQVYKEKLSITMLLERDSANFSVEYLESIYKQYQELAKDESYLEKSSNNLLKSIKSKNNSYKNLGTQAFLKKIIVDTLLEMHICINSLKAFLREDRVANVYRIPNGISSFVTADTGSNNKDQEKVAELFQKILESLEKVGFINILGDFIYPAPPGVLDPEHNSKDLDEKFYIYHRGVRIPVIFGSAGNHEWGKFSLRKFYELYSHIDDMYHFEVEGKDRVWLLILHALNKSRHPGIDPRIVWAGNEITSEFFEYMRTFDWKFNMFGFHYALFTDDELNLFIDGNDLIGQVNDFNRARKKGEYVSPEDNQAAFMKRLLDDPQHQGKLNILKIHQPLYPHGTRFSKPDTKYYANEEELLELKDNIAQLITKHKNKLKGNQYDDSQKTKFIQKIIRLQYYYNHISGDPAKDDYGLVQRASLETIELDDGTSVFDKIDVVESGHEHIFDFVFHPQEAPIQELLDIQKQLVQELTEQGFVELAAFVQNLSNEQLSGQKSNIQAIIGTGGGPIQEQRLFDEFSTCIREHGFIHRWVDKEKIYHAYFYSTKGGVWYFNSVQGPVPGKSTKLNKMIDNKAEKLKSCLIKACNNYLAFIRVQLENNPKFGKGDAQRANQLKSDLYSYNCNLSFLSILNTLTGISEEYDRAKIAPVKNSLLVYILDEIENEFKGIFKYRQLAPSYLPRFESIITLLRDQAKTDSDQLALVQFMQNNIPELAGDDVELDIVELDVKEFEVDEEAKPLLNFQ